jgi:predicted enzyme related to lactoylglutathione lyase
MERVRGIGGVFFKARDPKALAEWYGKHLGFPVDPSWAGAVFKWTEHDPRGDAHTVWSPFPKDTSYFEPGQQAFMLNFRVDDLEKMLEQLRAAGAQVDAKRDVSEYGRFGWATDPEGNRFELWEPPSRAG